MIINLLDPEYAATLRNTLLSGKWASGESTAGSATRRVKNNQQLPDSDDASVAVSAFIQLALQRNDLFSSYTMPNRIHSPRFNRYEEGGEYGTHFDGAIMVIPGTSIMFRPDISATVFLTDPKDYEGGELEVDYLDGKVSYKLTPGQMVLYPSNTLHRVRPVTRGSRISAIFWLQSLIADEETRNLLFDLHQEVQAQPGNTRLARVYSNLFRRSASP